MLLVEYYVHILQVSRSWNTNVIQLIWLVPQMTDDFPGGEINGPSFN